jgi:hypothetical protein
MLHYVIVVHKGVAPQSALYPLWSRTLVLSVARPRLFDKVGQ